MQKRSHRPRRRNAGNAFPYKAIPLGIRKIQLIKQTQCRLRFLTVGLVAMQHRCVRACPGQQRGISAARPSGSSTSARQHRRSLPRH